MDCRKEPVWKSDPIMGVTLTISSAGNIDFALSRHQVDIMAKCLKDSRITDLMEVVGRADRTKFRHQVLRPLLDEGIVEMTIPDKPNSSRQKYRLTALGLNMLDEIERDQK